MHIEEHKSLKDYNTFNIKATARYFSSIGSIEDLKLALFDLVTYYLKDVGASPQFWLHQRV